MTGVYAVVFLRIQFCLLLCDLACWQVAIRDGLFVSHSWDDTLFHLGNEVNLLFTFKCETR